MISFRAKRLIEKLLSFKFVIFLITTFLRAFEIIGNVEWLTITSIVLAGHEGQKGLGKYLERRNAGSEETELGSN